MYQKVLLWLQTELNFIVAPTCLLLQIDILLVSQAFASPPAMMLLLWLNYVHITVEARLRHQRGGL